MNPDLNGCGLLLLTALAECAYAQQPVCTIVPPLTQRIPPPGGPVTVTANCTGTPFFCGVSFPGWTANGAPVQAHAIHRLFAQTLNTSITSTTTFTLSVQNASGTSAPVAVTVEAAPPVTTSPSALPNGTVGTLYSQTLSAAGGSGPPYAFNLNGVLPAGLSLSQTGVISGTPTAAGQSNFVVFVTDSLNVRSAIPYSISIAAASITISPPVLPNGVTNAPDSQTLTATNGTGLSTFAVTSGTLPDGLTLSSDGFLSGTPGAAGGTTFTVTATDSTGAIGTRAYTLNITQPPTGQIMPVSAPVQIAQPNTPLAAPLVARVVDLAGNAIAVPRCRGRFRRVQGRCPA